MDLHVNLLRGTLRDYIDLVPTAYIVNNGWASDDYNYEVGAPEEHPMIDIELCAYYTNVWLSV